MRVEDPAGLLGSPDVEVVVQDLLEEDPPRPPAVEHLGQRELGLQNREFVAAAGGLIGVGEWIGQDPQPRAQQRLDVLGPEAVTDLLEPLHVVDRSEPVVQRGEADPAFAAWRLAHSLVLIHNLAVQGK